MKAAVLEKLNAPLVIDDLAIPSLSVGQVLVKVMKSTICGKQIGEISGHYGEDKYLPHLLGHEGGGIVEKVGEGVNLKPGQHVVMHWRKGKGIEAKPAVYSGKLFKYVGAGPITTFSEYAVVSENRLTVIPDEVPFEIASLMGCAVTTGLGIINNEAQLKMGQSIAVFGCGGVGMNIIQGAAMVSAYPIVAIDKVQSKLHKALVFGATNTIISREIDGNIWESFLKLLGKSGFDVTVDCTGNPEIIELAYSLTADTGKCILVGQPCHSRRLMIENFAKYYGGKQLFASQGGLTNPTVDIPRYINLYMNGKLKLDTMITHRFDLDEINDAIETLKNGNVLRCAIDME